LAGSKTNDDRRVDLRRGSSRRRRWRGRGRRATAGWASGAAANDGKSRKQ